MLTELDTQGGLEDVVGGLLESWNEQLKVRSQKPALIDDDQGNLTGGFGDGSARRGG